MYQSNRQRLCYGHIIAFYPPEDEQSFIFCDGFISKRSVLKNFKSVDPSSKFLDCQFQIYPSFLNSGKKAALGLKKELKTKYNEASEQKKRELIQETLEKVSHEYKFNQDTFDKLKDTAISFDTPVQFLHITSNKFLKCNFEEEANYEKENFKLELTEYPSENTFLKFLPVYTYQKRNDGVIYLDDSVHLVWASQYLNKIPFIHMSSDFSKFKPRALNIQTDSIFEGGKLMKSDIIMSPSSKQQSNENEDSSELNEDDSPDRTIPGMIGKPSKPRGKNFSPQAPIEIEMKPQISSLAKKGIKKGKIEKNVNFSDFRENLPGEVKALPSERQEANPNSPPPNIHAMDSLEMVHPGASKREINVSLDSKSLWKMKLIRSNITDQNILCYGDIVWLNYSEKNSTLIAKNATADLSPGSYRVGFVNSVFSEQQDQNYQGDTNAMWMIEAEDYRQGGMVEWGSPLRLKHSISGLYLSIGEEYENEELDEMSGEGLFEMVVKPSRLTLFEFTILPTTISKTNPLYLKHVPKDAFMKLKRHNTKYWMKFNHEKGKSGVGSDGKTEDINTNTGLISYAGDEIAFKIYRANENEVWETNFLISCKPFLLSMLEYMISFMDQANKHEKYEVLKDNEGFKFEKKLKRLTDCLRELNMFTMNERLNTSPDQKYGNLNPYRQKLMKELGFVDICIELLRITLSESELRKFIEYTERRNEEKKRKSEKTMFSDLAQKVMEKREKEKDRENEKEKGILGIYEAVSKLSDKGNKLYYLILEHKVEMTNVIYVLLTSICKNNADNENYVHGLFSRVQYQAKYLKCSTDCIISVISDNEGIVSNMADAIKISNANDDQDKKSEDNLIEYFLAIAEDQAEKKVKNCDILRFFRSVCKHKGKGISDNQEILYKKLLEKNLALKNENLQMKIELVKEKTMFLDELFKEGNEFEVVNYPYFLEQLNFFSDLALDRNYLWKTVLEKIFPINFVFSQISEEKLSREMRSAFCNLALTLYVDHEPRNLLNVPNMCRVYIGNQKKVEGSPTKFSGLANLLLMKKKISSSPERKDPSTNMFDQSLFEFLIEQTFKYINMEKTTISETLSDLCKTNEKNEVQIKPTRKKQVTDFLDNILLLDIIRLTSILIRFDVLNKRDKYAILVPDLVSILEFDRGFLEYSYVVAKIREDNLQKNQNIFAKNRLLGGFKNIVGSVFDNFTEISKSLVGAVLGSSNEKTSGAGQGLDFIDYNDPLFYNSPLMRGLISIRNQLELLKVEGVTTQGEVNLKEEKKQKEEKKEKRKEEKQGREKEKLIKMEICELLIFFCDLRTDFLITNFLKFFEEKTRKMNIGSDENIYEQLDVRLSNEIEEDGGTVIPPLLQTGIYDVDLKYKSDNSLFNVLEGAIDNVKLPLGKSGPKKGKSKKFLNYTEESEMPDLDSLMGRKMDGTVKAEILPSLILTFFLNKDPSLENKILEVIMKCFNQRKEFSEKLRDLQILFDSQDIKLFQIIQKKITNLRILLERSEIWINNFLADYEHTSDIKETLSQLSDCNEIFFQKLNFDDEDDRGLLNLKRKTSTKEKEEEISKTRQDIFRFVKGYQPLVKFVKDSQNQIAKIIRDTNIPLENRRLFYEIMKTTYTNLKYFCQSNSENQKILIDYLDFFLDELQFDFGQTDLVNAIFKNNKYLCENCKKTFEKMRKIIKEKGRQKRFLEFFKIIQRAEETDLIENQLQVAGSFLPITVTNEENASLLYGSFPDGKKSSFEFLFQFDQTEDTRDEPFFYHSELLDMFAQTLQGSEAANINLTKIQEIFKIKYLLGLLLEDDDLFQKKPQAHKYSFDPTALPKFYQDFDDLVKKDYDLILEKCPAGYSLLKPKVLEIIYLVYLNPQKISLERIYRYSKEFIKFLQKEEKRISGWGNLEELPQREINYFFDHVIKFMRSYHEKVFGNEGNSDQIEREDKIAIDAVYKLIRKNINSFKGKLTRSQINRVTEFFVIMKGESKDRVKEDLTSELEVEGKSPMKQEGGKFEKKWELFRDIFLKSSILETELKKEKDILGEALVNIIKLFTPEIKKAYKIDITFQDLLQKLINFLNYGLVNKAGKKTMIYILEILENIIRNEEDKTQMQNFFDKFNATKMFLNLISDSKVNILEDDLLKQLLSFMIQLLEGGNQKVQKTIFNFFTYYPKSENLFWKFHGIITEAIKTINDRNNRASITSTSTHFPESSQKLVEKEKLKSEILMHTLRLLQLFTEGHNSDLQNYVREQTNSRNKYDMVSIIVELLESYHQNLDADNYENYTKCLDTLTEFVQGPCPSNQQSIIDGKFLEIANDLLIKKPKKNKGIKNSKSLHKRKTMDRLSKDFEPWMLERLRHKCMILVMSLVELQKENTVIKRIIRSLPLDILKDNIIRIYKRYKKLYPDGRYIHDCLKHFDGDPLDKNEDKPFEYYELILETGFYIYFLILHYLEIDIKEIDTEMSNELQEIEQDVEESAVSIFKNNIISQLLDFVRSLLESVFHYAKYAKSKIWKFQMNNQPNEKVKDQKKRELYKEAIQFFSKNSAHIEVVRNEELERVHFFLLPSCHYLPKETKNEFHDKVNRTSAKSKVTDLVDKKHSTKIIEISKHEETLDLYFSKNKIVAIFAQYVNLWKDLSFLCAILLNIVIICSYGNSETGDDSDEQRLDRPSFANQVAVVDTKRIFDAVGICMSCFSVFVVIFYVLKKAPLVIKDSWKEETEEGKSKAPKKKQGIVMRLLTLVFKIVKTAFKLLNNFQLLYYLAYGATALTGVFFHEFFFTFHMTEILVRYPYIIKAVWEPKKQLFLTLILFILIEYFFTIIGYVVFYEYYAFRCENIYMCFFETFDQTFKDNGGIGQLFEKVKPQTASDYNYGRFFFDNAFNIVLVIVLINIVAGIIIDKFGSLRERENEKTKDIKGLCFICGHTKETFDRRNDKKGGFTTHIKKDHYMWNYLFYIAYLNDKDETEHTGIESYIFSKIKKYDCSWFPINRALILKNIDEDEEKVIHKQLNEIDSNINGIKSSLKDLSTSTTALSNKMTNL